MDTDRLTAECSQVPTELICFILELAAYSSKESALSISRVCSWARELAATPLFRTLVLHYRRGDCDFHKYIERVRNLWIQRATEYSGWLDAVPSFHAMPQVINLALWGPYMWPLLEALTEMGLPSTEDHSGQDAGQPTTARPRFPCRSLHTFDHIPATTFRTWSKSPIAQHFLGGLTHLRLENCQMSPFIPVEHLTNITHIAVPGLHLYSQRVLYEMLDSILELETLQMLVVVLPPPPGENDDVSRVGSSIVEEYYSFQSVYFAFRTGNLTPAEWQDDIGMGAGSIWNSSIPLRKLADGSLTVEQLVANNWRA